ncbi:MAG: hypothetical protein V2I56_01850 [Desulfobacteraceae bacterium]|nr:hypothetical protein [Desulfobacteraceae bacterium]
MFTVTDRRDQIASYRQLLLQKDRERFDADSKNYEEELMSLYELAGGWRSCRILNIIWHSSICGMGALKMPGCCGTHLN